jgi:hypothetical protein
LQIKNKLEFSPKQKRSFQTILSGLKFAKFSNKPIRFLTLTTSELCSNSLDYDNRSLNNDFQKLRKRILRYSPYRLYKDGYISKSNMTSKYGRNHLLKKFFFEYFKVITNEGNGVIHILYRGSYLPHSFIVDNWTDIHNSWSCNIKHIDLKNLKSASSYVVSQYVSGQGSSYVRSSMSHNWVFYGFKSKWYKLKRDYRSKCFELWDKILYRKSYEYFLKQWSIDDFG